MKRLFTILFLAAAIIPAAAQDYVTFELSDGISEGSLKFNIELQASKLLTALNAAERTGQSVNFRDINIDEMASHSIAMLWENVHFRTFDDDIVTHCLTLPGQGIYEVRGIELEMKPVDASYTEGKYREACINFDKNGRIVDFYFAMDINQYMRLMKEGLELDDLAKRQEILYYVEQLKKAYNDKNMDFMEAIFSEDALIITGKVIRRIPMEGTVALKPEIRYSKQTKQQYLANLKNVFSKQAYLNVDFTDFKVVRSGYNPNFYGVTVIQNWRSSTYSDEGILFLVWDFTNPDLPLIHVRTWQPMETDKNDIFTLDKFKY